MKNIIIVDVDTEREDPITLGKPTSDDLPKNKEEAKDTIIKDMICLTEALVLLISVANTSGYKSTEDSLNDIKEHLNRVNTEVTMGDIPMDGDSETPEK